MKNGITFKEPYELLKPYEKIMVSPYNLEAKALMPNLPKRVSFSGDIREAEQAAGVVLSLEDKIELVRAFQDIGITEIVVGYPYRSKVDMETAMRLKREGITIRKTATVVAFLPDWKEEIDAAIDAGVDYFNFMIRSSDIAIKTQMKMTREQVLERIIEVIEYGKSRGVQILPTYTDTTRADPDFLKRLLKVFVDAGGRSIGINDTAGCITPSGMKYLVRQIRQIVPVSSVHCHNDFGLATANTLAAIEEGATTAMTVVNGLGERAGSAPLDEVVVALECLYGVDTGIKLEKLYDLAKLVEKLTGVPVYPWKPLVGENAFCHKLDSHVFGVLQDPRNYEAIPPELVGNKRKILIGKYAGKYAIGWKLEQLGLTATNEQVTKMIQLIEEESMKKKRDLTDEEFVAVYNRVAKIIR